MWRNNDLCEEGLPRGLCSGDKFQAMKRQRAEEWLAAQIASRKEAAQKRAAQQAARVAQQVALAKALRDKSLQEQTRRTQGEAYRAQTSSYKRGLQESKNRDHLSCLSDCEGVSAKIISNARADKIEKAALIRRRIQSNARNARNAETARIESNARLEKVARNVREIKAKANAKANAKVKANANSRNARAERKAKSSDRTRQYIKALRSQYHL